MDTIILKIADIIYRIIRVCVHYICAITNGIRGKKVPPVKNPILLLSATELAKRIREGTLSSASVVQAYIDRIIEVDLLINATVDRRFHDAIEEAKNVDDLVASGKKTKEQLEKEKPLLGVPFTVKILITVKGLRCTAGSLLFKDLRAQEDSPTVALMKKAGAIVLASTNSSECGLNLQSSNKIHGTTSNPYDTSRTSGGSSGGESALIGAAGSVIGIGNDIGGSVRIPGSFTGIYGHKASRGIVSNEGCFPIPDPKVQHMLYTGPMCRYAEDLITTMRILSAPDEISNKFVYDKVNFKTLKVYYLCSFGENLPFMENVDPEIKGAVKKVVSHFQEKGSTVKEISIPIFKYNTLIFFHALFSSISDVGNVLTAGKAKLNPYYEFIKFLCFRSIFTLEYVLTLIIKKTPLYNPDMVDYYKELGKKLDDELNALLDEKSILVLPTMPFAALYNNEITMLFLNTCYTSIFNVLGLPATQCPVEMNKQGLPLGIQIVGRRGNDPLTISCSLEIEKSFGGWKAP